MHDPDRCFVGGIHTLCTCESTVFSCRVQMAITHSGHPILEPRIIPSLTTQLATELPDYQFYRNDRNRDS